MASDKSEIPFSLRYALPAQVSENLSEVSWETVIELSSEYQVKAHDKSGDVKKALKELQMMRLLLLDKIGRATGEGEKIDPALLVSVVRLLERCEKLTEEYDIDLRDFSSFLYMLTEKLKKEKLARHNGSAAMQLIRPMEEELSRIKDRVSPIAARKPQAKGKAAPKKMNLRLRAKKRK